MPIKTCCGADEGCWSGKLLAARLDGLRAGPEHSMAARNSNEAMVQGVESFKPEIQRFFFFLYNLLILKNPVCWFCDDLMLSDQCSTCMHALLCV